MKLWHKGLIVVAIPLVCQIIFLGTLVGLLRAAEDYAKQQDHSRNVLYESTYMSERIYDMAMSMFRYMTKHDNASLAKFDQCDREIRTHIQIVRDLIREDPDDALKKKFDATGQRLIELVDQTRQFVHGGINTPTHPVPLLKQYLLDLREFVERERMRGDMTKARLPEIRTWVVYWIGFGTLANVGLALVMLSYFNTGIINRLRVLAQNSERLARKVPLLPPVGGTDEISQLDSVFRDMSAALMEAMAKVTAVVEHAQEAICSLDSERKFSTVNPATQQILGYNSGSICGVDFAELVPEDKQQVIAMLDQLRATRQATTFECRMNHSDGRIVHISWSAYWSENEANYYCVGHDISAQKEVEKIKQEFLDMVSHDLRTPLTSLKAVLTLLSQNVFGQLPEKAAAKIETSEAEIDRLMNLVNGLLEIQKMEAGKMTMLLEDVPLSRILEKSIRAVTALLEQHRISVITRNITFTVHTDEEKIIQVIVNLISNAIKFSPDGASLTVAADSQEGMIRLSVIDQGRGIPTHLKDAIFDRFRQVSAADSHQKKGIGLGLAICKAIVEQQSGTIGVVSNEGSGSTFWFTMPISAMQADDTLALAHSPESSL